MSRHAGRVVVSGAILVLLVLGGLAVRIVLAGGQSDVAPGAAATSLAVDAGDGSLLKAAGGLFRSADRGQSWQPLSLPEDVNPDQVREVATTTAAPDRLFVAGPGAGILRSDDRGATWRTVSDGLPSQEVGALAVHSYLPDTLYAWIAGRGAFRTEDGGQQWTRMDEGPTGDDAPLEVRALAHSTYEGSMNTGWLYAATPDGPYLSMDCF